MKSGFLNARKKSSAGKQPARSHEHEEQPARSHEHEHEEHYDERSKPTPTANTAVHSHQHQHSHGSNSQGCAGCCSGTGPKNPTTKEEVMRVRETWLERAMREIDEAEAAEEEAHAKRPSLESLPAAEDLMEVVVANVIDWPTLMCLRTASHWLREIVTRQMATVGIRSGPRLHDYDERGVLHLLGSAFGQTAWSLDETLSRVRVFTSEGTCSSPVDDESERHPFFRRDVRRPRHVSFNNPVAYLVDRAPRRVFLHEGIGGWMALDLGPFVRVAPEAFTLRHSSQQERALRSFRFEGCRSLPASLPVPARRAAGDVAPSGGAEGNPDEAAGPEGSTLAGTPEGSAPEDSAWETLLTVEDDERLGTDAHSSASWEVGGEVATARGGEGAAKASGYRCFRVIKTGPDAADFSPEQYLHLSGIEIYGQVRLSVEGVDGRARQGEFAAHRRAEQRLYRVQPHLAQPYSNFDHLFYEMGLDGSASDSEHEASSASDLEGLAEHIPLVDH